MGDALYVRLVDLTAALAARTYAADVDVVLDVTDAAARGTPVAGGSPAAPTGPTCARTDDAADLALDVRELGAAYLGGTSLVELAGGRPGRRARPEAVRAAATAFAHSPAPWCPVVF